MDQATRHNERDRLAFVAKATAVVILVVVLAVVLYSVRRVALIVFIGFFLAIGFEPVLRKMEARGPRRGTAVLVLLLGLLVFLGAFVWLTLRPAVAQLEQLVRNVPWLVADIQDSNSDIGRFLARPEVSTRIESFLEAAPGYVVGSLGTVFGVVGAVVGAVFAVLTVVTLMVYFMLAMPRMLAFARRAVRTPARAGVLEEALGKVGGYVTGQLTVSVTAGVTSYAFFLVTGVPYAAVLAITVAIFDAIPQVGAMLGAAVATIVALTVSVPLAVGTLLFLLVYQQVENYVIAPRLFSRAVNLSPVAVFVAILIGASLAGVVGALVALPTTAALKTVFRYVFRDRLAAIDRPAVPVHHAGEEDPVHAAPHL